jgi:hypothetical protein
MTMKYLYSIFILFMVACGSTHNESAPEEESTSLYPDGTYCSNITYHNPNTGTRHTYTLNVEVENNEMITIYWGNGGWLDESHFTPKELDDNGECSFTSDRGYEYQVKITGPKCTNTNNPSEEEGNQITTFTLAQCASSIQMTEAELKKYEADFQLKRTDVISDAMCNSLKDYIIGVREIHAKMDAMNMELENGRIQDMCILSALGEITCQQIIVNKKGIYYWLEVQGLKESTMGTMQFDHTDRNWQQVTVKEGPESKTMQVFYMRIKEKGGDLASMKAKMHRYCKFL